MTRYLTEFEIEDKKLDEIMERLNKAQEEIYECYSELEKLGILKIVPKEEKPPAAE